MSRGEKRVAKTKHFFQQYARLFAGLIILICLAFIGININQQRMVEKSKGLNAMYNVVVPIHNGDVLEQTIWLKEEENNFGSKLAVCPGTYQRTLSSGEITFSVLNDREEVICEKKIPASDIKDNEFIKIEWGGINKDTEKLSQSGIYTLRIQAQGLDEEKDLLVFWCGKTEGNEIQKTEEGVVSANNSTTLELSMNGKTLETQIYAKISYLKKDRGVLRAFYYLIAAVIVLSVYPMLPRSGRAQKHQTEEGQ